MLNNQNIETYTQFDESQLVGVESVSEQLLGIFTSKTFGNDWVLNHCYTQQNNKMTYFLQFL